MTEEIYCWGNLILLGATLLVLVWYTCETRRIAKAAIEQTEVPKTPCLIVKEIPPHSDNRHLERMIAAEAAEGGKVPALTVWLRNIGAGPALNIRYRIGEAQAVREPMARAPRAGGLSPGGEFDSGAEVMRLDDDAYFVAEYESLSGQRYRSSCRVEKRRRVLELHFEKIRASKVGGRAAGPTAT